MGSHGKAICLAKRCFKNRKKITDESETGFNFSRQAHTLCNIMLENMVNKLFVLILP